MSIQRQTIVIVGGSSGMGLAAADALAQRGARVVLVGRSEDKLRAAADQLSSNAAGKAAPSGPFPDQHG